MIKSSDAIPQIRFLKEKIESLAEVQIVSIQADLCAENQGQNQDQNQSQNQNRSQNNQNPCANGGKCEMKIDVAPIFHNFEFGTEIRSFPEIRRSFECSCGGHDVQLPGVEKVTPAMILPASTFAPISTLRSRSAGGFPAIRWSLGFSRTSLYETNFNG